MSEIITLAHGGGGKMQNDLIRNEIATRFNNNILASLPDGAVTPENLVISSDSFVITPRFFPGGNIGKLAVAGTVNDILMAGGVPKYLTCSLIIEEGLEITELRKILDSMQKEAANANVLIVTGETKVVPRGRGDGIYINTAGVGFKREGMELDRKRFTAGDKIIVSGNIGEHGLCVMANRYDLDCGALESDCQVLKNGVETVWNIAKNKLKFMRDATRGGVLGIISEIFENTPFNGIVEEAKLPVGKEVAAIAKLLGIDPGFAACEGCFVTVVAEDAAEDCVKALQTLPKHENAAVIGTVCEGDGTVELQGEWGALRKLIVPSGDQLPRIC